jgi:hypothetical protein
MARPPSPTKKNREAGVQISAMLRDALESSKASKMREVVAVIIEKATVEKDLNAIKLILDRLEGLAKQTVVHEGSETNPVQVMIADANDLLSKLRAPLPPTQQDLEQVLEDLKQPMEK